MRMIDIPEYLIWRSMKGRCLTKTNSCYPFYGGSGISIQQNWADSYEEFISYVGMMPNYIEKYSLDRINNSKGYCEGNVRWVTLSEQSRNRTKCSNNTTGITGVYLVKNKNRIGVEVLAWRAMWVELDGKQKGKAFSVNKYGNNEAFDLACLARDQAIKRLNIEGAGYIERHGK